MVEQVLLALKALFLVLLYVFVWRVIRAAGRDLGVPQESVVLAPGEAAALGLGPLRVTASPRLVVLASKELEPGMSFELGPVPLTAGRAADNSIVLPADNFASARHARFEAVRDTVSLVDLGSTNGTFVNGERIDGRRRLRDGDVVKIGETELRFLGVPER